MNRGLSSIIILVIIVMGFIISKYIKARDKDIVTIKVDNKEAVIARNVKDERHLVSEYPQPFGYKCSWLAVKSNNPNDVISALKLKDIKKSNWSNGLEEAYNGSVFVSPSLGEWVLVISISLPDIFNGSNKQNQLTPLLISLSKQFGEAQYFSTHRVVEYHAWGKAVNGKILRMYCYLGESSLTLANIGEITKEELELNFHFFDENSADAADDKYWERNDLRFPDEEDVLAIAKKMEY